jgi:hypothetical protein
VLVLGTAFLFLGAKRVSKPKLKYFTPAEFGPLYTFINNDLLVKLDQFRELWGRPVVVSPVDGGVGRHDDSKSQHNINLFGETRAIDVFPSGMNDIGERQRALRLAKQVGFTGIGLYTDTRPSNMLHVDVRQSPTLATWARVGGNYVAIERVV